MADVIRFGAKVAARGFAGLLDTFFPSTAIKHAYDADDALAEAEAEEEVVEVDPDAGCPPTPASGVLHGVPTFAALQETCADYLYGHALLTRLGNAPAKCQCGLELGSHAQWVEHFTELLASALSFVIAEARNTPN